MNTFDYLKLALLVAFGLAILIFRQRANHVPVYKPLPGRPVDHARSRTYAMFVASHDKQCAQRGWANGGGTALGVMRSQMDFNHYKALMSSNISFEQIDAQILYERKHPQ